MLHSICRAPVLMLIAGSLAITGCGRKPDAFFAPLGASTEESFGAIEGSVLVDGSPFQGTAQISLSGPTSVSVPISNGTFFLSDVPPGTYTVTLTTPSGVTCISSSQQVTIAANQTENVVFECTDGIPALFQIEGDWLIDYNAIQSSCGTISPFGVHAMMVPVDGALNVVFPDAPEGGEIVGSYNEQTGMFAGITGRVQLENQPEYFGQESWSVGFSTFIDVDRIGVRMSGTSFVAFTDEFEQPVCDITYDVTGEPQ